MVLIYLNLLRVALKHGDDLVGLLGVLLAVTPCASAAPLRPGGSFPARMASPPSPVQRLLNSEASARDRPLHRSPSTRQARAGRRTYENAK
jgi:hypothetical protein